MMPSYSKWLVFLSLLLGLMVNGSVGQCADEQVIFSGQNVELEVDGGDEAKRAMMERMKKEQSKRRGRGGEPPKGSEGKPDEQKKDEKKEGKPDGGKEEGKDGGGAKTVKRPTEPKEPFDPRQYEAVKPDLDGRYRLSFVGTPWPPMIEWLEEISGRTADWQELPGDFFNLRTQRAYSVPEIEDIVNRLLLARGYTLLVDGELMTVEKTEGINASMVPRIPPEELRHHRPYEFARVLFDLDWLMAEQVAKELKLMVSKNGSLTPFTGTNRVEVMDAVRNLQQINEMINQEQSASARDKLVQEFQLRHVAAKTVVTSLKELVGSGGSAGPKLSSKQIQQIQQQIQQMKQRRQDTSQLEQQLKAGSGGGGGGGGAVSFVINDQRNSIIATAPPNKMVIIERTIKLLDVQDGRNDSLDSYVGRIKPYRLISLNPTEVVKILTETGGLDPKTKLTADDDSKSLIASAPPWDHMTIQKLIDKLDGSTRQFHVLRIRRRRVDQVATTIQTLMVGEEKKDEGRRYRWWGDDDDEESDKFRVAADIEHKQLLVWCNEQEYQQVLNLLQELGEVPEKGKMPSTFRVLEEIPAREAEDFLKRVKEAFEQMAPNAVQIDPSVEETLRDAAERVKAEEARKAEEERKAKEAEDDTETDGSVPRVLSPETQDVRHDVEAATTAFVQATTPARAGANPNPNPAAPVRISLDSNGRIVIKSDDPRALDLFEEISGQLMPRPKGFHVFKIKHGMATWIVLKLETFFEDSTKKDNDVPWWYFGDYPDDSDDKVGLGDRPEIKFVSEIDSNTIVVRNATESQLKTIEELLKIYDIPEPVDPKRTRYTTIYKVKHSRASLISETVKSAFPDLLSSNDSVVQRGRQKKNGNDDDDDKPSGGGGGLLLGQLSIGADDVTNTLIVSTKGEQLQNVLMPIIKRLDEEALKAETVKVYALPEGASSEIAESLSALLGSGAVKNNKEGGEKNNGNEEQKEQQEREEARRRRGRRDGGQPDFGRRD